MILFALAINAFSHCSAAVVENAKYIANGSSSDLAQHFYNLHKKNRYAPKIQLARAPPSAVQKRLEAATLTFDELPAMLQRALLWDTGYVWDGDDLIPVQVRCGDGVERTMADIQMSADDYLSLNTTSYQCTYDECGDEGIRARFCLDEYVVPMAKCAITWTARKQFQSSMWATGGDEDAIPVPYVINHLWKEYNGENQIMSIHTIENEAKWGECPDDDDESGAGIIIPCIPLEEIKKEDFCTPKYGALVESWLGELSPSTTKAGKEGKGMSIGVIVMIIVGAVVVLAIMALVFFWRRKQKSLETPRSAYAGASEPESTLSSGKKGYFQAYNSARSIQTTQTSNGTSNYRRTRNDHPDLMQLLESDSFLGSRRIDYASINFISAKSKGAYGEVWYAQLGGADVAVKRLLPSKNNHQDVQAFITEIQLTATLDHPNIIQFVGVAWDTIDDLCLVMEFLPFGDVQSYVCQKERQLSWDQDKMPMAMGLASALDYLHTLSPIVIHRDVKAKNVLLTEQMDVKLIDFGVSRDKEEETMTAGVGTPYWTAPEVLDGRRYSEKSDIYSYGVFLSELDTGRVPYSDATNDRGEKMATLRILQLVMAGSLTPTFTPECPDRIRKLADLCMKMDPAERPNAREVVSILRGKFTL